MKGKGGKYVNVNSGNDDSVAGACDQEPFAV
jgi:hypothetical protein